MEEVFDKRKALLLTNFFSLVYKLYGKKEKLCNGGQFAIDQNFLYVKHLLYFAAYVPR